MARAPNPKMVKAKKLYEKGLKLAEIAEKLEVPNGTVNRWSYIKYDIKKDLKRGQLTATKERLEEMCTYLKHVYTFSKSIWLKAREDLRSQ